MSVLSLQSSRPSGASSRPPLPVIALTVALLTIDFFTGPYIQFPVFFAAPVMLAAWYHGLGLAVCLGVIMAVARFTFNWIWQFPVNLMPAMANVVLRGVALALIAYVTARTAMHVRALRRRILHLEARLPVCRSCGVIQTDDGKWVALDGLPIPANRCQCPACEEKNYGAFS